MTTFGSPEKIVSMKGGTPQDKDIDMKELGRQLGCPSGENGISVAKMMNESNAAMTLNTIAFLGLGDGHTVLELGPANGAHLADVMAKANDLRYYGLDISETMVQEARKINAALMSRYAVSFEHYDGQHIPYDDHTFDRIMTVNTIYFWSDPRALISGLERTLKPGGSCVISFVQKEFMKNLPFVGENFQLYDDNDMRELVRHSAMELVDLASRTEEVRTKSGERVQRTYSMAKLKKPDAN